MNDRKFQPRFQGVQDFGKGGLIGEAKLAGNTGSIIYATDAVWEFPVPFFIERNHMGKNLSITAGAFSFNALVWVWEKGVGAETKYCRKPGSEIFSKTVYLVGCCRFQKI